MHARFVGVRSLMCCLPCRMMLLKMPSKPKPFSSEWFTAPPPPPERPRRVTTRMNGSLLNLAPRLPAERRLSMIVVIVLVMSSFWFAGPRGVAITETPSDGTLASDNSAKLPVIEFDNVAPPPAPTVSTDSLKVVESGQSAAAGVTTAITPPTFNLQQVQAEPNTEGGLFPANRILAFYGFPGNDSMGILGEYSPEQVLEQLREQAKEYEEADPSRPVLIAFEVIASVAQKEPQVDGSYLRDASTGLLNQYTEFAEENDILLFFDVQVGYRTVQQEIESLRPWLEKPFVHVAIDPEFAMHDGEIPGDHIGQVDASDVTWAQNYLADLSAELNIPPKVLIVHQFLPSMIENKDKIAPVKGVQLVIDCDGFGTPADKRATYGVINGEAPIEYNGMKLFYDKDVPLLTAEEVIDLDPSPDLIIYQ